MHRKEKIEKAKGTFFDVAIIGGGITGAGIFLKCCERNLRTVLIDGADFASGTSSRSAKMIHGGLRYLQYLQVKLVKEALVEREYLLTTYPHLVRPLPFLLPIYDSRLARVKLKVGLIGYDALAGKSMLPKHRSLGKEEIIQSYPMLRQKGLKGGFYYYDAITNDARLTNEVIMEGCLKGGTALNYVSADSFDRSDTTLQQINCTDELTGAQFDVKATHYISAAGVWTDEILDHQKNGSGIMNPSKGVHLVVSGKPFPENDVLLIPCEDDRFIWICPWEDNMVIIGATDTPFNGDLREPGTTKEDVEYLLRNTNNYLKDIELTEEDILSAYSGLRPLLNDDGESDTVKVSRDYKVWWEKENLLAIAGGKLTSFLSMADNVVNRLSDRLEAAPDPMESVDPMSEERDAQLLKTIRDESPAYTQELHADLDWEVASVIFFIRYQHAEKISDILSRRLSMTYSMKVIDQALVSRIADVMEQELGWSSSTREARETEFQHHWEGLHSWTK